MANFSYSDYQNVIARAQQANDGNAGNSVKVGFFKLKNDADEALVRFNVTSLDDLQFATVHQLGASTKWMKVSCLNPVGSYAESCPLCAAVAGGNTAIGKATKKVYVQMLVSYKDPATQSFSVAIPVVWERPAGFSRELAGLLKDYGPLTEKVFKITRNGAPNNMQTTYSIAYIPLYDTPENVPSAGLAAFANFNIAKHSFWEKSHNDIEAFLSTGSFPEIVRAPQNPTPTDADAPAYTRPQPQYSGIQNPQSFQAPAPAPAPAPMPNGPSIAPAFVPPSFVPPTQPGFTPPAFVPPTQPTFVPPAQMPAGAAAPTEEIAGRAPRAFGGVSY